MAAISRVAPTALPCLPSDLLVASADATSIASCAPQLPFLNDRRSETAPRPSIIELVAASVELARAPLALRMLGLNGAISEVSRRKARLGPAPVDMTARLDSVTGTFTRLRGLISAHDRCLPRSIAIARRLTALGVAPTLTLGVKLQPFGAHCWVRCGDRLISDRWDDVRHFTPILVI